jgi:hypothetical protein
MQSYTNVRMPDMLRMQARVSDRCPSLARDNDRIFRLYN